MNLRPLISLLGLAAVLAVGGCASPDSTESSQAAASAAQESVLSAEQVQQTVADLLADDPSASIVDNQVMQSQLEMAKDMDSTTGITPQKCAEQMAQYTVTDLTGTVASTGTSSTEDLGKVIQIFSITDPDTRDEISHALTLDDISGCESVTVEQNGQQLQAQRQLLELDVNAEQSLTMSTQMDVGGGQKLSSVVVQALSGNNFVIVTLQTGQQQPATFAAEAVELADRAFEQINTMD